MLLREADFLSLEGGAPLLMQNHRYLHRHANVAWSRTRKWTKLLLGTEETLTSLDEEKKLNLNMSGASMNGNGINHNSNNNNCSSSRPSPSSLNYGLQIMKKPDRIIRKDADRTFLTEAKRQLLITLLQSLQTLFNDYQQTMSYVSGILLLFFEPKTVFEMMFMLGRSPKYNMSGYWRSEAVAQGIDAYVLYEIVKKVNPDLYAYLQRVQVLPDTFIQKWFGGLAVQVMPTEFLIEFWTQFFEHGFRYLFKFAVSLLQALSPMLLSIEQDYKLYEVLRVERKTKFWRSIGVRIDGVQIQTEEDAVSAFFAKVLSDANSVGKLCNIEDIDFQREREKAFDLYLRRRFLNAAQQVTWKGYVIEEDDDDEDEAADCAQCEDGFGEFWCDACQIYLCEECKDNPTGDHALNHAVRQLDIGTLNVD